MKIIQAGKFSAKEGSKITDSDDNSYNPGLQFSKQTQWNSTGDLLKSTETLTEP